MARPLSEEKRNALIVAAAQAIATSGVAASTLKIAKAAGVAEGTLFRYFPTKDDLLVAAYFALKLDLTEYLSLNLPLDAETALQFRHLWDRFIDWGTEYPDKHRALRHLEVALASLPFANPSPAVTRHLEEIVREGFTAGVLREQPIMFMWGIIQAIADVTLAAAGQSAGDVEGCKQLGWEAMWGAVTK